MPIYYKKVNHDAAELGLIESGLGTTTTSSSSPSNGHQNSSPTSSSSNGSSFLSGVQKKLASASGFGGSRSSLFGSGNGSEVELERISSSFHVESEDHLDDLHLGGCGNGSSPSNSQRAPFLLKSKATNEDRDRLMTKYGPIVVVKQFPPPTMNSSSSNSTEPIQNGKGTSAAAAGAPPVEKVRPVILTYHDIGLNYFSNFESFFSRLNVRTLLSDFRIFHLNAPGQEEAADGLPETSTYQFPSMDDLAEQVGEVCRHYGIEEFIGFGYGAGANVLSRFALSNADMVEALFLVNPSATTSTWAEWFYQKLNIRALNQPAIADPSSSFAATGNTPSSLNSSTSGHDHTLPPATQEYFIWHLFGNTSLPDRVTDEEAVAFYRRYLDSGVVNRRNLAHFIESYIGRPALGISRDDKLNNFKCPVALIVGDYSPHVDEAVKMNGRLDPTNSTWVKLADCSMVLEEQPNKVVEVLRLFLQGLGYTLKKAMRAERSFLSGKSMPCLAAGNGTETGNGNGSFYNGFQPSRPSERMSELRRGTVAVNEV